MSILTLCDVCKKEIKGENVGQGGYRVESGERVVTITITPCDMCIDCLLEIVIKRPKRKYERKEK